MLYITQKLNGFGHSNIQSTWRWHHLGKRSRLVPRQTCFLGIYFRAVESNDMRSLKSTSIIPMSQQWLPRGCAESDGLQCFLQYRVRSQRLVYEVTEVYSYEGSKLVIYYTTVVLESALDISKEQKAISSPTSIGFQYGTSSPLPPWLLQ